MSKTAGLFGLGARASFRCGVGQGDRPGEQAGETFFLHAVGLALDVDDGGAVQEAVQGGAGHDGVAGEGVAPVAEGFVGGDDRGGLFVVALADHLEEERGLVVVEAEVVDFIDNEQLRGGEHLHVMGHAVGGEGGLHAPGQLHRTEEEQALTAFGAGQPQGDRQVGFADAGRTLEDDVAAFVHEASGGQFLNQRPVDGGLEGEVKIAEALLPGEPGEVQTGLDHALAARGDLGLQQPAKEVGVTPVVGGGLLGERVESGVGGGAPPLILLRFKPTGGWVSSKRALVGQLCAGVDNAHGAPRQALRGGVIVAARARIAAQLTTHRRSRSPRRTRYLAMTDSGLSHDLNCMALVRRQLPVGSNIHTRSFGHVLHFTRQCAVG